MLGKKTTLNDDIEELVELFCHKCRITQGFVVFRNELVEDDSEKVETLDEMYCVEHASDEFKKKVKGMVCSICEHVFCYHVDHIFTGITDEEELEYFKNPQLVDFYCYNCFYNRRNIQ